jgi:hypothetical protein
MDKWSNVAHIYNASKKVPFLVSTYDLLAAVMKVNPKMVIHNIVQCNARIIQIKEIIKP